MEGDAENILIQDEYREIEKKECFEGRYTDEYTVYLEQKLIDAKVKLKKLNEHISELETSEANLNIGCVSNCYMGDCLIQDSCFSFKTKRCNKDCKSYQ